MNLDNLSGGFFKLQRAIFDHAIFKSAPHDYFRIWVYLIGNAAWKAHTLLDGTPYPRGCLFVGARKLAAACRTGHHVTRACLDLLVKAGMIEITAQQGAHLGSLITIRNYDAYQSATNPDGTADGTDAAQTRHRRGTDAAQTRHQQKKGKQGEARKHGNHGNTFSPPSGGVGGSAHPCFTIPAEHLEEARLILSRIFNAHHKNRRGTWASAVRAAEEALAGQPNKIAALRVAEENHKHWMLEYHTGDYSGHSLAKWWGGELWKENLEEN